MPPVPNTRRTTPSGTPSGLTSVCGRTGAPDTGIADQAALADVVAGHTVFGRPYTPWRLGLLAAMAACFAAVALVPAARRVAALTFLDLRNTLAAVALAVIAAGALVLLLRLARWLGRTGGAQRAVAAGTLASWPRRLSARPTMKGPPVRRVPRVRRTPDCCRIWTRDNGGSDEQSA